MQAAVIYLVVFVALLVLLARPLGSYMLPLAQGRAPRYVERFDCVLLRVFALRPVALGAGAGASAQSCVDGGRAQTWLEYTLSLFFFNVGGLFLLYVLLRNQAWLPLNPAGVANMEPYQAFNTAVSFVTNTNWQSYSGESAVSYLSQMAGLSVQNFLSAASGIAVAFVLMRSFAYAESKNVGNFFVDLVHISVYLLLPLAVLYAIFLVSQGVIQNLEPYLEVSSLFGGDSTASSLAMGPVASQEAIKLLGTNGGGFFNANSAHPFENPTALSSYTQCVAIFAIAAALPYTFGLMVKDKRQGWTIFGAMALLFVVFAYGAMYFEHQATPDLVSQSYSAQYSGHAPLPAETVDSAPSWSELSEQAGAEAWLAERAAERSGVYAMNMEGKEVRFDLGQSMLFTTVTTAASCGAVNNMHDSLTPMAGLFPTLLMQLGEVVFGGVGAGFYGIMVFCLIAVFIAGLMVGRTPEYLGKKVTVQQMKLACLAMLCTPVLVLVGTAVTIFVPGALDSLNNPSAHGFSEIMYALASGANNNGSAFAGLNANTPYYNVLLALAMFYGRFVIIACMMALAGSLITQKLIPASSGTLPTHGPLFMGLLVGTILLIGALTYIPMLALGPVVDHLMLWLEA